MTVFVDTSALFALLDADDRRHAEAATIFASLAAKAELVTHNYVHVEALALTARRLGRRAARVLVDDLLPGVRTAWVDESLHRAALAAFRDETTASFVDHVSFEFMRRAAITSAFAFDADFPSRGFAPASAAGEAEHRVTEAIGVYGSHLPGSDLVSISEIAVRAGRSVHTVQSWRRRNRSFPEPLAQLAAGPIWSWTDVRRWIRNRDR